MTDQINYSVATFKGDVSTICELGLVYGMCIGKKGQDTTQLRKISETITDENGDDYSVCEGCRKSYFDKDENWK